MIGLFDIGGTHTRVAISAGGKELDTFEIYDTPQDFNEGVKKLSETLKRLAGTEKLECVSGGCPGNMINGLLKGSPHLPKWAGNRFADDLERSFPGVRILVENDAKLACLGEAVFGSGKGYSIVAYYTISTGIGGGRVVNGKIDKGRYGIEPGHQIIDLDSIRTLESYASGSALLKQYGRQATDLGKKEKADMARALAIGIHNSIRHWGPDAFILGGSIILNDDSLFESVQSELEKIRGNHTEWPMLKRASLGDRSGLYGALALAAS